ncbi:hypothetical protein HanIR_Chr08g0361231 [Helianthus annuus]|nr:hypothetical protein HanIR_Chr08g0361231 [Helianthus annuus]
MLLARCRFQEVLFESSILAYLTWWWTLRVICLYRLPGLRVEFGFSPDPLGSRPISSDILFIYMKNI